MYSVMNVPWFMCTYAKVCSFLCLSSISLSHSLSLSLSLLSRTKNKQNCTHQREREKLFFCCCYLWVPFILSFTFALLRGNFPLIQSPSRVYFLIVVVAVCIRLLLATLTLDALKKVAATPEVPKGFDSKFYQVKFMWSIMPYNNDDYNIFPYRCCTNKKMWQPQKRQNDEYTIFLLKWNNMF